MLILPGSPALSAFRLEKLATKLSAVDDGIQVLRTQYVHFENAGTEVSDLDKQVLESLLSYGPVSQDKGGDTEATGTLYLVVPRPGTISPWSSKATDIAHNCGVTAVQLLERGVAYYLELPIA